MNHYVGERHHRAKLSDHDVTLIRQLRRHGLSYHLIAEKFDCGTSTVRDIVKYRTRKTLNTALVGTVTTLSSVASASGA